MSSLVAFLMALDDVEESSLERYLPLYLVLLSLILLLCPVAI
jgi:hypothetical protein